MSIISEFDELENYIQDDYSTFYHEETFGEVWQNCVVLSISSVLPTAANIVILNFIFGCLLTTERLPKTLLHIFTGCIGIYLITSIDSLAGKFLLLGCWIISLIILYASFYLRKYINSAHFVKIVLIFILVLCEYYYIDPHIWLQIRGIVMVLVMKVISLADDIGESTIPHLIEYFGYTLCGANVMFGPWISFSDYLNLYKKPTKKNITWIFAIIQVIVASLLCLSLSNCWGNYLISHNSNRWFVAYKEAFSFRTSHYFISYLAEAGMIASGFTQKKQIYSQYRFTITEPLEIELPSSLSMVVKKWNQPMHDFLKRYVFRSWLVYGKFYAIFATFFISSLLHGFEVKVSMVLVSLGVFSYLQVAPRDKIAEIFNCCVKVRPCKDCTHKYKRDSFRVKFILVIYSLATVFHLAYLGVLMDPSTDEIGIYQKWQNLYFVSHIIMAFNLMIII